MESSKASNDQQHPRLTSQISIQPNIPNNMLVRSNSRRIVTQKAAPTFPTKTLRMKSLLWTKPTGIATNSLSSTIKQLLPTLILNLAALSSGISLGFSAIALPQLKGNNNGTWYGTGTPYQPFPLDMESGSWIAGIFGIGAIFGGFAAAILGSKYGQRLAIMMIAVPDMIGWILIASAQNVPMMLMGRFLSGFAAAGYSPSIQTYIAEIAQPQHRGWLGGITTPVLAFGTLISYTLGSLISWHFIAIIGAVIPLLLIPGLALLHDSPYWHLQKGDEKKALAVMESFRKEGSNSLAELLAISDTLSTSEFTWKESLQHLTHRQYRRPFLTLNALFLLMTFTGNFAISFYAVEVFQKAGAGHINEYLSAIIIGAIRLLGSLLFIPAVKHLSRRLLMCGSSFVMGVSMSVLGLAMYSHETGVLSNLDTITWLPLVCVTIYMLADPVGVGSVPFLYLGEFFPSEMRSLLSGITIGLSNLELFIVVKTFPNLTGSMIGTSGTFWLYAGFCFVTLLYTLVWIPETRGRSLQDIERYFEHKESLHVTPLPSPVSTPTMIKKNQYPQLSVQFTL